MFWAIDVTLQDVEQEIIHLDDHYHSNLARVRAKFDLLVNAEAWSNISCDTLLNLLLETVFIMVYKVMLPPF